MINLRIFSFQKVKTIEYAQKCVKPRLGDLTVFFPLSFD